MADLATLKRTRGGHRAAATRSVKEVSDVFGASPGPDAIKLGQLKQGLQDTFDSLKKFDEQILPLVDPGAMDKEIEDSERIKDELFLAMSTVDHALSILPHPAPAGSSSPVRPPTVSAKLPKLTLKSFNGSLVAWTSFWDSFKSSVHDNPSLAPIDKFSYLQSLMEGKAKETIAGLALTDANYPVAVDLLEKRFGSKEKITAAQMEALMSLNAVSSDHHLFELRRLYDKTESTIRGLTALGVSVDSYGALLAPVFIQKLPSELRLTVTRKVPADEWNMTRIMEVLLAELEARERASLSKSSQGTFAFKRGKDFPTAATFTGGSQSGCCFCQREDHTPAQCTKVTGIDERKRMIREQGRCFVCLRPGHISKHCRSSMSCVICKGRHHSSVCMRNSKPRLGQRPHTNGDGVTPQSPKGLNPETPPFEGSNTGATFYSGVGESTLLQLARVFAFNLNEPGNRMELYVLLDSGSQCSYITHSACQRLGLASLGTKSVSIMTFGSRVEHCTECNVVKLGLELKNGAHIELKLLSVNHICEPLVYEAVDLIKYPHLRNLDFSISLDHCKQIKPDILIGSDQYWSLLTGEILKGSSGPVALNSCFGWILSGTASVKTSRTQGATVVTHVLRVDGVHADKSLDRELHSFWELESLGILEDENLVQTQFSEHVKFDNGQYIVSLPWKDSCISLPSNYQLCLRRLIGLFKRLKSSPELLKKYDDIIREQLSLGIIVPVDDSAEQGIVLRGDEHESYAQSTLGKINSALGGEQKVLGVLWDPTTDEIIIDLTHIFHEAKSLEPTKRKLVSVISKIYDPMGLISPVVIKFKILFQGLCNHKIGWDDPLPESLLIKWKQLLLGLQAQPLRLPRYCITGNLSNKARLIGFCDASLKAYAAAVYLENCNNDLVLLTSKTRVSPLKSQTVPRLELLGAVLLARLISNVKASLKAFVYDTVCFTDSLIVLYWIKGLDRHWKPFVQNRVREIRERIDVGCWNHCQGKINPADMPSRGMTLNELYYCHIWFHGPPWLESHIAKPVQETEEIPPECMEELRVKNSGATLSVIENRERGIGAIVPIEHFSSYKGLINCTAHVLSFIGRLKGVLCPMDDYKTKAKVLWLHEVQKNCIKDEWKTQFMTFLDKDGLYRCGGRLGNSDLPYSTRYPILLSRDHPFTVLVVRRAHQRVSHSGVKDTLTEVRSQYWIPQGKAYVRQYINKCVLCRRYAASHYSPPPPPPLPEFRVKQIFPFSVVGVDFAGPLMIKEHVPTLRGQHAYTSCKGKAWVCLFTCGVTRAVHLDIVTDMSSLTFLRCFKRFVSRRGLPSLIVSDNGATFKSAAKVIQSIMKHSEVQQYLSDVNLRWSFNIERAPWWGGFFERMVQLLKRCLRKMVGQSRLTYDELLTSVTEVEMILNSRPLTYISASDMDEPVTPSHLILGKRLMTLPDYFALTDSEDYSPDSSRLTLTKRLRYLGTVLEHFWNRWKKEYLLELRDSHRYYSTKDTSPIAVGDVVIVYDEAPRGMWKLGLIDRLIRGRDKQIRGAVVRVRSGQGSFAFLKRPVQRLYPLEVHSQESRSSPDSVGETDTTTVETPHTEEVVRDTQQPGTIPDRPCRKAATEARDRIIARLLDS